MMITSSVYVHLQRPDNREWLTVGRYTLKLAESVNESTQGFFQYAPSYIDSGLKWIIDPINMPRLDVEPYFASRYGGLSDVLRDISPDAWGKLFIQRAFNLPARAHEYEFLMKSSNADRWGALTVSKTRNPNPDNASSPRLSKLEDLLIEPGLMAEQKPSKYPELRNRLTKTPSLGGARPKATVQDGDVFWLVKPTIQTDVSNTSLLEYVTMGWAKASGLNVAECSLYRDDVRTALLVKRFDRIGMQRHMVLSGATLLQTEYPVNNASGQNQAESRWRLSPAFDIVPNIEFKFHNLAMQLSDGRWGVSRQSLMADWKFFGFKSFDDANQ